MPCSFCLPLALTPATTSHELARTLTTPDPDTPILNQWVKQLGADRVAALLDDDPCAEPPEPDFTPLSTPVEDDEPGDEPTPLEDVAVAAPGFEEPEPDRVPSPAGPDDTGDDPGRLDSPADDNATTCTTADVC